ncbi:HflK protein [Sutcliffiella horikoshii]|uniref:Protein HflK n=2 Tax=Sutcliffiella horikoshii TaxID=79883 RepID=A0A1Y0CQB5_9BACI|nr:FtsH protease activity modulator HflK [Sutcliffiella horikoshii]ART77571.1 HflK protein [Sutcliffiella horikoshii]TYS58987.1 FtsH protease activity modulator HflK [Sutcliffiella horikoshii]TYS71590.1 FtsH protease activity modulator HflK [Sutcliffiella horikoshii]
MMSLKRIYTTVFLVILAAVIGSVALTSWYTVDQSEQAVIMTFGKVEEGISEPGLHFKMPWPIQTVETMSKETFSLQFGYEEKDGEIVEFTNDTKMITGDENIVLADMVVMWKISEPGKYLFNSDDPQAVLYNATSASLRSIIGSTQIDEALTSGKAQIEVEVFDLLTSLMETYDIGISITSVNLQDVELPNEEVRKAFTDVTDAREMENTKNNEAKRYQNQRMNEAEGEKDAIISKAEGEKAERIERARGDVAKFNSLYKEYVNAPELTRKRLILETMEEVLPYAEIYIMNDDGNTMKYFPLRTENPAPKPPANPEGSGNNE